MKFNVNQQDLQQALNYCQGVIEKRSTLPILSNVLMNVSNSNLTITATDLDLIFIHQINNVEVIEEGNTTTTSSTSIGIFNNQKKPNGLFIPTNILRKLRPHQIIGCNFLLRALQGHPLHIDEELGFTFSVSPPLTTTNLLLLEKNGEEDVGNGGNVTDRLLVKDKKKINLDNVGITVREEGEFVVRYYDDASKYQSSSSLLSSSTSKSNNKRIYIDSDEDEDNKGNFCTTNK